ncbi:MAG: dipeptide epimerase [Fimbriimonadaceae bacterium]|nr:dipeptide epimerase [Fimbriimonadaceae bacterium]QYK58395.1 MAG: dipeptide epimerase [Fimbriimonadaceae bacterium]
MIVAFRRVRLNKRHPLMISRGLSIGSWNLFVTVSDGVHTGIGECAPGTGHDDTLAAEAEEQLRAFEPLLQSGASPHELWASMHEAGSDPAAMAALDVAHWDLIGRRAGLPLNQVFGLPWPTAPTSVTVGINPPDVVLDRADEFLARTGARFLKVKLGNPEGHEADQEQFLAAKRAADRHRAGLRTDANGGWSLSVAKKMVAWLAEQGCDSIEQPLPAGAEDELADLVPGSPLPIFLDESVRTSSDAARLADRCHGVNLKLMKTGGLTEALRLVAVARAHGLQTMIGCMGESSVAISAGASIGALFDQIDLDSHLNLSPDPAEGTRWVDGVVLPSGKPGHGAELNER